MSTLIRRSMTAAVLAAALAFMPAGVAHAKIINVPADFGTIQEAVNNASPGDEIVLSDGTYDEATDLGQMGSAVGQNVGNICIRPENPGGATVNGGITSAFSATDFTGDISILNLNLKSDPGVVSVLFLSNIGGAVILRNNQFLPGYGGDGVAVVISDTTETKIELSDNSFDTPAENTDGLNILVYDSAVLDVIVAGNTFSSLQNDAVNINVQSPNSVGSPVIITGRILENNFDNWVGSGNAFDIDLGDGVSNGTIASLLIENNDISGTLGDGLDIDLDGINTVADVIIRDNIIANASGAGIFIDGGSTADNLMGNVRIANNTVNQSGESGIEIKPHSKVTGIISTFNLLVSNNVVNHPRMYGVYVNATNSHDNYQLNLDLLDNSVEGNTTFDAYAVVHNGNSTVNLGQNTASNSGTPFSIASTVTQVAQAVAADQIPASLGDLIWDDLDGNGIYDSGSEAGMPGIPVNLTGTNNNGDSVSFSTTTDGNGIYLFPALLPGNYAVSVIPPADYVLSTNVVSAMATRTAAAVESTSSQIDVALVADDRTIDFGFMLYDPNNTDDDGDGFTENQGDCDDTDPTIHPNATEVCGDGIDQDCNGEDAISQTQQIPTISDLQSMVDDLATSKKIKRWLSKHLASAERAFEKGYIKRGKKKVVRFMRLVDRLSSKKYYKRHRIKPDQANELIMAAASMLSGQSEVKPVSISDIRPMIDQLKTSCKTKKVLAYHVLAAERSKKRGYFKLSRKCMARFIKKTVNRCHYGKRAKHRINTEEASRLIMAGASALVNLPSK